MTNAMSTKTGYVGMVLLPLGFPDEGTGAGGTGDGNSDGGQGNQNGSQNGAPADKGVANSGGQGNDGKTFSFKEDRSDWMPRTRFNEQSQQFTGKLTAAEQRAVAAETALAKEQGRVRALSGLETPTAEEADADAIRQALYKAVPGIKMLENLTEEQLAEVLEAAQGARATTQASWERHATTMLNDLESEVATGMNVDKLTPTQQRRLQSAYREEAFAALQVRKQGGDPSNDFIARHERGDKTLIKEFSKAFLEDFYVPARRQATSSVVNRNSRPVPRGERTRQSMTQAPAKIDYNNKDAFKQALLDARNASSE